MAGVATAHSSGEVIAAFAVHADLACIVIKLVPATERASRARAVVVLVETAFLAAAYDVLASRFSHKYHLPYFH